MSHSLRWFILIEIDVLLIVLTHKTPCIDRNSAFSTCNQVCVITASGKKNAKKNP